MTSIKKIWKKCLTIGAEFTVSTSERNRLVNANRVGVLTFCVFFLFIAVFAILGFYILIMLVTVFVSMLILAFVLCSQNWIKTAKFLYVLIPCLAIFLFANILGESEGSQYFFFCIIPPVFTYYNENEKKHLFLTLLIPPVFWFTLELYNYDLFTIYTDLVPLHINILRIINTSLTFGLIFLYLYQYMNLINKNEYLLIETIKSLTIKEKELRIKNSEFSQTTTELIGIQQLLSSNQSVLKQERDKAEKANRVKSDFLSSMSHEIRTPMNVIVGLTDLLIDIESDNEKLENLELIKNSSNNLLVIINDILDFSKMNSGKLIIENIDFDLHKKVAEVVRIMSIKDTKNKIGFNISSDTPVLICSDPVRINQVFINLMSNANKFTQNGKVELNVSIKKVISPNRANILFEVRDTGIGIAEGEQAKIFDSFTQASSSTTRRYGGTGLGLPICKRIVELMDGNIWVESSPGKGSSFFFELPINCKPVDSPIECLVTEDFDMNQMMIEHTLESLNIHTTFVTTKEELERELTNNEFKFMLVDFTKDDFSPLDIKEILDELPSLNMSILAYDNYTGIDSPTFECSYIVEPLNKMEIMVLQKNDFRKINA